MTEYSPTTEKLSLLSAILININIMLGSGIFINTVVLSEQIGALGALGYGLVGILILPLILSFSQLLSYYPTGGTFYDFGLTISPLFGFINSWAYYIGKLATPAIGIHVFVTLMQTIYPFFMIFNPLTVDSVIVILFILLNLLHLKTGRNINFFFITLKMIPILFVIFTAFFFFNPTHFELDQLPWQNLPAIVPLLIFAFAGFEASCSLSKSIENPEKNGPRAIMISYLITLTILMLYQLSFFGVLGALLGSLGGFQEALPHLIKWCAPASDICQWLLKAITLSGIATSALGSSYGVIFSNVWNLYVLAEHGHLYKTNIFLKRNKYGTPFSCVIATGLIIICYQLICWGNFEPLKQIAAIGNLCAYTISMAAFLYLSIIHKTNRLLALLSLSSCLMLCSTIVMSAMKFGALPLFSFMVIIFAGIIMYYTTQKQPHKQVSL